MRGQLPFIPRAELLRHDGSTCSNQGKFNFCCVRSGRSGSGASWCPAALLRALLCPLWLLTSAGPKVHRRACARLGLTILCLQRSADAPVDDVPGVRASDFGRRARMPRVNVAVQILQWKPLPKEARVPHDGPADVATSPHTKAHLRAKECAGGCGSGNVGVRCRDAAVL